MIGEKRKTGIDVIGEVPWGTHFCQFYQTKEDLLETLIPYFKAGLESNEFCMWVTSEPLKAEEVKLVLGKAIKNLDDYIRNGQIEILDYTEWYTRTGTFDADRVLQGWVDKENEALKRGFDGLRLTGNTFWLEKKDWQNFTDYEEEVNNVISEYRILAICTYSLDKCGASEIIDVVKDHQFALIRREGKWELIESIERKRAEETVRKERERAEEYLNIAGVMLATVDADEKITLINNKGCEILGYKERELLGMNWFDTLVPQRIRGEIRGVYNKLMAGDIKPVEYYENPLLTKGGEERLIAFHNTVLRNPNGQMVGVLFSAEDITGRKLTELALRGSERKYRSLVNNVKLGVFRSTPEPRGRFLEVNPAMERITGYSRKELLQMDVSKTYAYPEQRIPILEEIVSAEGKATKELRLRKKDGSEIVVSDTKVAVRDDAGRILYFDGIMEDITERKQAEEREEELQQELALSSRLAAIGELAAGVAHEINNPLTGIIGFSERLLRKTTDEEISRDLELIYNEALRTAKVVENFLTFARRRKLNKQYEDINDIVQKALELRAYELKTSNIEVVTDLAPSLPQTMVDFQQIQEVLMNIILNAEQTMTEANCGGKLAIKTQQVKGNIRISFTNDGHGIPAEHLDKLFDPFFTTRGGKGGTGLGLSVCHGIVAEHGGKIYAKSKPGKETTFFVELPLTNDNPSTASPSGSL